MTPRLGKCGRRVLGGPSGAASALMLLSALAACRASPTDPLPMSPPTETAPPPEPVAFGRLRLALPADLTWATASARSGGVSVVPTTWAGAELDGDDRAAAFDAAWAGVLADAERKDPPLDRDSNVIAERDLAPLDGRPVRAVLGYTGMYGLPDERRWDLLLDAGAVLVRAHVVGSRPPDALLDDAVRVLASVRTAADEAFGTADWLYAGPVALALPEAEAEEAGAGYEGAGALSLRSTPRGAPIPEPPLRQRYAELAGGAFRRMFGRMGRTEIVRSQDRSVAGLPGQEVVAEVVPREGDGERRHVWEASAPGPRLLIEWVTPRTPPPPETVATWDAVLDSVAPPP